MIARCLAALAVAASCVCLPALAQTTPTTANVLKRANPASQNCTAKGGRTSIEYDGGGGQFGVCTFPDNLQCEEWAMMRGACRVGGIKVTGYVTPAARYCAITGGAYTVTSISNTAGELGTCTFKSGRTCEAAAYFEQTCTREENPVATTPPMMRAQTAAAPSTIKANFVCAGGKSVVAVFNNGANSNVKLTLSDGRELVVPQTMSGSGARYANSGESFVFWNKGNTAFIEENGKQTFSGCTARL